MFDIHSYQKAGNLAEALDMLAANPQAKPLAGGTSALFKLRRGCDAYQHVVDISDLPELAGISLQPNGDVRLGAGVTFRELTRSALVSTMLPCLAEAAQAVGGPQLRAKATLGGNLCGGGYCATCRVCRFPRCPAAMVGADAPAPLLVLGARAEIATLDGTRLIPLEQFWKAPSRTEADKGAVLLGVVIPAISLNAQRSGYSKYAMRASMDTAFFGCAALCRMHQGCIQELRMACVMAGPTPQRFPLAESVGVGRPPDAALCAEIAQTLASEAQPRATWQGDEEFRRHIIRWQSESLLSSVFHKEKDA